MDRMEGWLNRLGIEVRSDHGQPAVGWPMLADRLDTATVHELKREARKCHFDLERRTWTVASFPELAALWDNARNGGLQPSAVQFRSEKLVSWRCKAERDHAWREAPASRVQKLVDGSYRTMGCPFCSSHRITHRNSLAAAYPNIARDWHPRLNGSLRPNAAPPRSNKTAWWRCAEGHIWKTTIANRTRLGTGCPYCARVLLAPENSLAARQPALAAQWHPSKNGDLKPTDVASCSSHRTVWWKCPVARDHEWQASTAARSRSPSCPFCANRRLARSNSLARRFPALARQWHQRRNGQLRPEDVIATARHKAWWKCPKGSDHEWSCRIEQRVRRKTGCPFCAGKHVSKTNSLATLYPKVAVQFHPRRNGKLRPSEVVATSNLSVWWRCPLRHDWFAPVRERTVFARGCPVCAESGIAKSRQ